MNKIIMLIPLVCLYLTSFGQIKKYNYKSKLEPNSKMIVKGYNYTLEKLKSGKCVFKYYYPENKMIISYVTTKSRKSSVKDGLSYNQTDAGELITKGYYVNDKKEGLWIENETKGEYKNNVKEGKWVTLEKEHIVKEEFYINGKLNGDQISYDTLGNWIIHSIYKMGEKIDVKMDTTFYVKHVPPIFSECKDLKLYAEELRKCSMKESLNFVYSNIKYPKKARKQEIDGTAIAELTIGVDGSISNIKMIRALSIDIKNECERVLALMPNWVPGKNNGVPMESKVRIPISFKLN